MLAGCDGQQVTGTWELDSMDQNGAVIEGDEPDAIYGGPIEYVINSDGTITVKIMGQETEGTWEQEENVETVTYNGLVSKFQKDGNKLILDQNGIVFTITKK